MGATPSPPPTSTTVPSSLRIWLGKPSGPMKSRMLSPSRNANISKVVLPTAWTTTVTVPLATLKSATVRGMRSPCSSMRAMTKCPGRAARATSGAFTSQRKVVGPNCILRLMRNTTPPGRNMVAKFRRKGSLASMPSPIVSIVAEVLPDALEEQFGIAFFNVGCFGCEKVPQSLCAVCAGHVARQPKHQFARPLRKIDRPQLRNDAGRLQAGQNAFLHRGSERVTGVDEGLRNGTPGLLAVGDGELIVGIQNAAAKEPEDASDADHAVTVKFDGAERAHAGRAVNRHSSFQ